MERKQFSRDHSLKARPLRNESLQWEKKENGEVSILLPCKKRWWAFVFRWFFHIPEKKTIVLDKLGSEVWQLCSGKYNVEEMIVHLSQSYKLNRKEAEVSLLTYLRQLAQKGMIGLAMKGE